MRLIVVLLSLLATTEATAQLNQQWIGRWSEENGDSMTISAGVIHTITFLVTEPGKPKYKHEQTFKWSAKPSDSNIRSTFGYEKNTVRKEELVRQFSEAQKLASEERKRALQEKARAYPVTDMWVKEAERGLKALAALAPGTYRQVYVFGESPELDALSHMVIDAGQIYRIVPYRDGLVLYRYRKVGE